MITGQSNNKNVNDMYVIEKSIVHETIPSLFANEKGCALLGLVHIFYLRVINDNRIMPTVQDPNIFPVRFSQCSAIFGLQKGIEPYLRR